MQNQVDFPLHTIKKVTSVHTGYYDEAIGSATQIVNALISRGWILLNMHTVEYREGSKHYQMIYTLGNTDPDADDCRV